MRLKGENYISMVNEYYRILTQGIVKPSHLSGYKELPSTINHQNWKFFKIKDNENFIFAEFIVQQLKDVARFRKELEIFYNSEIKTQYFEKLYINDRRHMRVRVTHHFHLINLDLKLFFDKVIYIIADYEILKQKIEYLISHIDKFYKI
jgi:hypothetical protein